MTNMFSYKNPPMVGYFPNTFPRDPLESNNFLEHVAVGQVLEPLVESAFTGEVLPGVASSWDVSRNSKSITFNICSNLKFSNGQEVKSADVKYSIERHKDSLISQSRGYLEVIDNIEVLDEKRVRIHLKDHTPPFLSC